MWRLLFGLATASPCVAPSTPLDVQVFNPGNASTFDVSSDILTTDTEAILFDAQFQANDAQTVVDRIRATSKPLRTVYISHSDPDYYFGLDIIQDAFPDARIVATEATVEAINATKDLKLRTWASTLGNNAPTRIVIPEPLHIGNCGFAFSIEGHDVYIIGPVANRTVAWIPSIGTILGGVVVTANSHVWMPDTQTVESRQLWLDTLDQISALEPRNVVPGHYLLNSDGSQPFSIEDSVDFTRNYVIAFNEEAAKASNSTQLITAMEQRYPGLSDTATLQMSAQVIKGEVAWP